MSALHSHIRDRMAYHGEGKGEMSFKNNVRSKSILKLRQIPIARQLVLDAAPSISHRLL